MNPTKNERLAELLKKIETFTKKDLLSLPGIKENPLSVVLIKKFMVNAKLDVQALVISLYKFSIADSLSEKLNFLFHVYDTDGDGLISHMELFDLLKLLNKGILNDCKIHNIADQTLAKTNEYVIGLNFEQFKAIVLKGTQNVMTLFNCLED